MKKFVLLFIFTLFSLSVQAKYVKSSSSSFDQGYKSPKEAINAFLSPLKKGKDGIAESMKASGSLNGESSVDAPIAQTFAKDMKEQGKVVKFKEIDSYSRLGGNMQKFTYEVEYSSGKKREVSFTILRPAAESGYYIMNMNAE